jgi:hypothetical protein
MEWHQLLKLDRLNDLKYVQHPYRPNYRQDIDHIPFSQPFRHPGAGRSIVLAIGTR